MASGVYQPIHPQYIAASREVWGPMYWRQLHARPDEIGDDPSHEDEWLQGFMEAIPCEFCKWHFYQYCKATPPDLSCNGYYRVWAWHCHNQVNLKLGKRMYPWPVSAWGEPPLKIRTDMVDRS